VSENNPTSPLRSENPAGVPGGLAAEQTESVEAIITRSKALDSVSRLEVYASAYFARLLECLREEFPATTTLLGEEAFDELAFGYLQEYPSTSYTLNHLSIRFAQYLRESRPPREGDAPDWADLLADLAELEQHFNEVFDGPGIEAERLLTADDLLAISPDDWPSARLVMAPCLRVAEFRFPLNDYYAALRRGETADPPQPEPSWMAITRRDYVVRRHVLTRAEYVLLAALLRGETVGEAIAAAAETVTDLDAFAAQLREWFHTWSRAGFIVGVSNASASANDQRRSGVDP
jgi:hypothetical protein